MDWRERLLQEKDVIEVYKLANLAAYSKQNSLIFKCSFLLCAFLLGVNFYFVDSLVKFPAIVDGSRELADVGFTFSTSILGFLISGFAIFAGISKPEVLIVLAKTDHGKHNISELQFIFFNFFIVFLNYLLFLVYCILIKITTYPGGVLKRILDEIFLLDKSSSIAISSIIFSITLCFLVLVILLLKSFIWNLYQSVLIIILVESEIRERLPPQ
ncbi:hypothetical protein ACQZ4R_13385 [Agrobacterium vitis]